MNYTQQVQLWRSRRSLTTALMWLLCFFNSSSFRWRFGNPMLTSLSTRLVGSLGGAHFACGGVYFFGSLKAGVVEVLSQLSPSHWIPDTFLCVLYCRLLFQLWSIFVGVSNLLNDFNRVKYILVNQICTGILRTNKMDEYNIWRTYSEADIHRQVL